MEVKKMILETPENLFGRLKPMVNKIHKGDFKSFVSRLKRPYFMISEEECKRIEALAGESDVMLLDGKTQVTWGNADGGCALMPLANPL